VGEARLHAYAFGMTSFNSITSGVQAAARIEARDDGVTSAHWFDDDPNQQARILHASADRSQHADAAALAERFLACLCTNPST